MSVHAKGLHGWNPVGGHASPRQVVGAARSVVLALAAVVAFVLGTAPSAQASVGGDEPLPDEYPLTSAAAELSLRHGKRKTTAGSVGEKLAAPVRVALNEWADVVAEHELSVVLPEVAQVVVLGTASTKVMTHAGEVLDETWELLADVQHVDEERAASPAATLVFLFDEEGMHGPAWKGVLEALVQRNELVGYAAQQMTEDPGPLMLRGMPAFLQPTFDMAGDASAGDDEFRLDNEVAHKLTQCVLKSRFGEVPDSIRWGLGFVVEQRLFRSIYQMNATGFVASVDHFDWPKKTRTAVMDGAKNDSWSIARLALRTDSAGRAVDPQMVTWGALDYLYKKDMPGLCSLLSELSSLHEDGAGWSGGHGSYMGDPEATEALFVERFDALDSRKLASHLKKVK